MAWTSMHFAMGMVSAGVLSGGACLVLGRGWRWVPLAMTGGGLWALIPDMPRLFREDFPSLPFSSVLGSADLENRLHAWGDLFFFHARLDAQPQEFALHGLAIIIALYGLSSLIFAIAPRLEQRRRDHRRRRSRGAARARAAHTYLYRGDLPEVDTSEPRRLTPPAQSS